MYNGIGLQTTRGSGTNGYVQKNCAVVRKHKRQSNENQPVRGDFANKVPNGDILLHAKKRDIEVKILEHREALEEQGLKEEEIEEEVARYRATLQLCYENEQRKLKADNFSFNNLKQETHHLAEANQLKNSKLREAFGISEYFQDGTSFDPERREREAQLKKEVEKKSYQWLKTPSPEKDDKTAADSDIVWRKESDDKQNENDQKDKKEDHREDKKRSKKLKKKSKHIDTSSSSSDSDDDSESSSDKYESKKKDSKRKRKNSSKNVKNKRRKVNVESDSSDSSDSETKSSKKKAVLSKSHKYHKDEKSFDIEPLHSSRKEEPDVCSQEHQIIDDRDSKKAKTNYESEDSLPEEIVKEIKKYKLKYAGHVKDSWIIKENNVAKRI
ncbi:pre-mRNA-splicing factor CWC21-like [Trichogramma pretiosum]|uniref:pre-mRNA-splicing factor CWC21-like n=1 Tax=Trichogramma pretiosum TaxID=7493 RepID=UPI0006C9C017|nr:pre-mRNA-splicing factor CWC21-like [Trichogramma pretiosum]